MYLHNYIERDSYLVLCVWGLKNKGSIISGGTNILSMATSGATLRPT